MKLKFGDELRNVLIKENLTQIEAADKMNMHQQQLSKYILSRSLPSIATAEKMLNAIGYELIIQEKGKAKK